MKRVIHVQLARMLERSDDLLGRMLYLRVEYRSHSRSQLNGCPCIRMRIDVREGDGNEEYVDFDEVYLEKRQFKDLVDEMDAGAWINLEGQLTKLEDNDLAFIVRRLEVIESHARLDLSEWEKLTEPSSES
jgi:hypothetical protein